MSVSIQTRAGVMRIQNADQSTIFQNFTEEELMAIGFALKDKADSLRGKDYADPSYIKFIEVMTDKVSSLVDTDF